VVDWRSGEDQEDLGLVVNKNKEKKEARYKKKSLWRHKRQA